MDTICGPMLLIYPADPKPCTVDTSDKLLTYPEEPRPCTVDTICGPMLLI